MRIRATGLAAAAVALLAGCGSGTADLMSIDVVSEGVMVNTDHIRITDDGRASCGGSLRTLPSQTVLDAREVKRALRPLAKRGANYSTGGVNVSYYEFSSFDGTVRWDADARAGLPPAIGRATLFALRLERLLCRGRAGG